MGAPWPAQVPLSFFLTFLSPLSYLNISFLKSPTAAEYLIRTYFTNLNTKLLNLSLSKTRRKWFVPVVSDDRGVARYTSDTAFESQSWPHTLFYRKSKFQNLSCSLIIGRIPTVHRLGSMLTVLCWNREVATAIRENFWTILYISSTAEKTQTILGCLLGSLKYNKQMVV